MRRLWAAMAVAGLLAMPGCLAPFRVHIDSDILQGAPGWVMTEKGLEGGGLGGRSKETRYTFDSNGTNPPFPGTMQVFSIRAITKLSSGELLAEARKAVDQAAKEFFVSYGDEESNGQRTLASGVPTRWFTFAGQTNEGGLLFDDAVKTRIFGEVGHDGRSDTSFVVVAIVQVERQPQCPVLSCAPQHSEATWIQVVGDKEGAVGGATTSTGFIDHLVTR